MCLTTSSAQVLTRPMYVDSPPPPRTLGAAGAPRLGRLSEALGPSAGREPGLAPNALLLSLCSLASCSQCVNVLESAFQGVKCDTRIVLDLPSPCGPLGWGQLALVSSVAFCRGVPSWTRDPASHPHSTHPPTLSQRGGAFLCPCLALAS